MLAPWAIECMQCPACGTKIRPAGTELWCPTKGCGARYAMRGDVPIVIHEPRSIFRNDDIASTEAPRPTSARQRLQSLFPDIGNNVRAGRNYSRLRQLALDRGKAPRVLVVGGRIAGAGIDELRRGGELDIISSDVAPGPETQIIFDAHDIPFADGTFDAVVAQAVLEHVVDPERCVSEIHRVLRPGGLVYAEVPFMQQVHAGRYDFTRFTHVGLLRLFRAFTEISSGPTCGPGMALAWSYEFFLMSLFGRRGRPAARAISRMTAFWLKYIDHLTIDSSASLDGASAYFILASRSDSLRPDGDTLKKYRGLA